MMALVFAVQADANAFASSMDSRQGYPKNGVDVGGGIHVPISVSKTQKYGDVIKHPTLSLWAYPNDNIVQSEVGKGLAIPITATSQTLDATWFLIP